MNYTEALAYFDKIPYFSKSPSNDNVVKILKELGNPERNIKFFHVAGTNGKGSVCAFLDSILRSSGYKTALFTSPHLVKINERIKISGDDISDEDFAYYLQRILEVAKEPLTFFELLFLMAILYFFDQNADYCILETGLGGTYDATNVVIPEISVITSIGLDHTKILGDTLCEIAKEKAGIIKPGVPIVYFDQGEEVNQVIETFAREKYAKIIKLSKDDIKIIENSKKDIAFFLESDYHRCDELGICTIAEYQLWNADLAIHAVKEVISDIRDESIREGIYTMKWPARMEEVEPHVILDGAHNPHAICAWIQTVALQFPECSKDLLFAVVVDKDYEEMISLICDAFSFEHITITCIPGARKGDPKLIEKQFKRYTDTQIVVIEDFDFAYEEAKRNREMSDVDYLFCLGSLYLAGMIESLIV